jgi:hypothetical protein
MSSNVKFASDPQAKQIYQYKNTKEKLYKNNAAIWCNKTNTKLYISHQTQPDIDQTAYIYDMIWYMIWYDMIYLLTVIGWTAGCSGAVHIYTQTIHRTTQW